jgi:REP element-mobilizing transposase RayT
MARPLRINYPGAFYHVTCRGNERKNIFADDRDRSMFLDKLKTSLGIYEVRIHAYVLMSNHFHLIVLSGDEARGSGLAIQHSTYRAKISVSTCD